MPIIPLHCGTSVIFCKYNMHLTYKYSLNRFLTGDKIKNGSSRVTINMNSQAQCTLPLSMSIHCCRGDRDWMSNKREWAIIIKLDEKTLKENQFKDGDLRGLAWFREGYREYENYAYNGITHRCLEPSTNVIMFSRKKKCSTVRWIIKIRLIKNKIYDITAKPGHFD